MATLGQQLKTAREAKGTSESEAGSATRILTKIILAMEADDFSVMPAPTYAKGFIRLYANYLGLDPVPLVEDYLANHGTGPRPLIDESSQLEQNSRPASPFGGRFKPLSLRLPRIALTGNISDLFSKGWNLLPNGGWKDVRVLAGAVAALLILIVLISSLSNCARSRATENPETPASQRTAARLLLDESVPDLYLIEPGKIESN